MTHNFIYKHIKCELQAATNKSLNFVDLMKIINDRVVSADDCVIDDDDNKGDDGEWAMALWWHE